MFTLTWLSVHVASFSFCNYTYVGLLAIHSYDTSYSLSSVLYACLEFLPFARCMMKTTSTNANNEQRNIMHNGDSISAREVFRIVNGHILQ